MSERYILTGAPGAGKTTLLNQLKQAGHRTVPEVATALIEQQQRQGVKSPWLEPEFISNIAKQQQQDIKANDQGLCFFDRSPFCTIALALYLQQPIPAPLSELAELLVNRHSFHQNVFYIESLDTIEKTEVRTISLDEAKRFGDLHRQVYREYGFQLLDIENAPVRRRVAKLLSLVS